MQQFSNPQARSSVSPINVRFAPVVNLLTGETVTLIAETEKRFEERAVFGRAALAAERSQPASPSEWAAKSLLTIANKAHATTLERPVIVPLAFAALIHPNTPMACDTAIRQTHLCAQEICFEVTDATLGVASPDIRNGIEALKRLGFRVSLDATKSWQTPLCTAMRILLDGIRINARHFDDPDLSRRISTAEACSMPIIAEGAAWRDGDYLAEHGVEWALRPRADA